MNSTYNKFEIVLGLPKSLLFNFMSLPFRQAIYLPILVSHRTKFHSLRGQILLNGPMKIGRIRIGLTGSGTAMNQPTVIENNGLIEFNGSAFIGGGCQICTVSENSRLCIGDSVSITGESHIVASRYVSIGNTSTISWNTQIMDTDFHGIYQDNIRVNENSDVTIGTHCWIASHVLIMKGTHLPDDCVVAAGSILSGEKGFENAQGCVITGLPHRILKDNISWVL